MIEPRFLPGLPSVCNFDLTDQRAERMNAGCRTFTLTGDAHAGLSDVAAKSNGWPIVV